MLSVSIKHPDSEAFIDAKMEEGKVTGANVSVKITDEFMQAVVEDKTYVQQFPTNSSKPSVTKEISAKALWERLYITHGRVPSQAYCFGIQLSERVFLIVMQTLVSRPFQRTHVVRFHSVHTIVVDSFR